MRTSTPAAEVEHLDGVYTVTRRKLAEPRLAPAAEAETLFQERILDLECRSVDLTRIRADPR